MSNLRTTVICSRCKVNAHFVLISGLEYVECPSCKITEKKEKVIREVGLEVAAQEVGDALERTCRRSKFLKFNRTSIRPNKFTYKKSGLRSII